MPKQEEKSGGAPEWMCTFSDMMSLLLCFFVLLFSMSTIEKKKKIQAVASLKAAFGGQPAPYIVENIPDKHTKPELSRPAQPKRKKSYGKDDLRVEIRQKVKSWSLQNVIQVTGVEQGITFRVSGDALFEKGSAIVTENGIVALNRIAGELIQFPSNPIRIEGHTDASPHSQKDGNWHLSAERAYAVMKFLVEVGCPFGQVNRERITYEAFSSNKPLPNLHERQTRIEQALNRRVEIILIQTDQGQGTFFHNPIEKDPRTPLFLNNSE